MMRCIFGETDFIKLWQKKGGGMRMYAGACVN